MNLLELIQVTQKEAMIQTIKLVKYKYLSVNLKKKNKRKRKQDKRRRKHNKRKRKQNKRTRRPNKEIKTSINKSK